MLLTGMEHGGQVSLTYAVENYPGFPDGVGGSELVELFQKQAERFGASVEFDTVIGVDFSVRPFVIRTFSSEYLADAVVISTGATPRHLNIPGEVELTGRGVSYCATCDGWFFKEKDVIVVGGGDSALEEGIFLTRFARSITIIHRREELRASAILQARAQKNPKIKFIWNSVVTDIIGDEAVKAVRIEECSRMGRSQKFQRMAYLSLSDIHRTASSSRTSLKWMRKGTFSWIRLMHTSIKGVFAAGEIADPTFKQVITSAGMGAAAAMQAIHYVEALEQAREEFNPAYPEIIKYIRVWDNDKSARLWLYWAARPVQP